MTFHLGRKKTDRNNIYNIYIYTYFGVYDISALNKEPPWHHGLSWRPSVPYGRRMAQKEAENFRREILAVADQKATRSRFFLVWCFCGFLIIDNI